MRRKSHKPVIKYILRIDDCFDNRYTATGVVFFVLLIPICLFAYFPLFFDNVIFGRFLSTFRIFFLKFRTIIV